MRSNLNFGGGVTLRYLAVGLVALLLLPAPAQAGRGGIMVAGHLGWGSGQTEVSDGEVSLGNDRVGGLAGGLRAGLGLGDRLVVGVELTGWGRQEDQTFAGVAIPGLPGIDPSLTTEVNHSLAIAAITATFHSRPEGGFYLRAGLGYGSSRLDFDSVGFDTEFEEQGLAVLGAVGHEWRFAGKLALAIEGEAGFLELSDTGDGKDLGDFRELSKADFSANFFNLLVVLNIYLGG